MNIIYIITIILGSLSLILVSSVLIAKTLILLGELGDKIDVINNKIITNIVLILTLNYNYKVVINKKENKPVVINKKENKPVVNNKKVRNKITNEISNTKEPKSSVWKILLGVDENVKNVEKEIKKEKSVVNNNTVVDSKKPHNQNLVMDSKKPYSTQNNNTSQELKKVLNKVNSLQSQVSNLQKSNQKLSSYNKDLQNQIDDIVSDMADSEERTQQLI